jgi:Arc/MetJ family transcription regulator
VRTNIVIDDELMAEAMALSGAPTKRGTVEQALREFVRSRRQARAIEALWGLAPDWDGDLDAMRRDRFPEWSRGEG